MKDSFGRTIDYIRISITEECNLHCVYCNPLSSDKKNGRSSEPVLTPADIMEFCEAALQCGIRNFKITGGEPLLRPDCPGIIRGIRELDGVNSVTLTTNGIFLKDRLTYLKEAGPDVINVSLNSVDRKTYKKITGLDALGTVLEGLHAALDAGLRVRINSVIIPGYNFYEWNSLIQLAKENRLDLRFIEMMPIGSGKAFPELKNTELTGLIQKSYPGMSPDETADGNGPAVYYTVPGFKGRIGFINSVSDKFCLSCNRIRLTAKGDLKACLSYASSENIKHIFSLEDKSLKITALKDAITRTVLDKPAGHCFSDINTLTEKHSMNEIGG